MNLHTIGNRYRRITMIVFLFILAAILVVIGVMVTSKRKTDYVETQATIVELKETGTDEDNMTYDVFVDYTVNGVKYEHVQVDSYSSGYAVGKQITVLYDPSNPAVIVGKTSEFVIILLFAGAAVCAVGGVALIVHTVKSLRKTKNLGANPDITAAGREIGEPEKLFFALDPENHVKFRFYLEDADRHLLYEGKMTKLNPVGANTYVFTDHVRHTETEHKVGHVNAAEGQNVTISQGFTFDGVEVTEYLDANKITVRYGKGEGISIGYEIFFGGQLIARAHTASRYMHEDEKEAHPVASRFKLNQYCYEIEGQRDYVDAIFLALFKEALAPRLESMMG